MTVGPRPTGALARALSMVGHVVYTSARSSMVVGAAAACGHDPRAALGRWAVAMAGPEQQRERSAASMFLALTGIATVSAACIAIGVGLGWLLDERTGAPHVFVFVGLALGIVAAIVTTTRTVKRYLGS